MPKKKKQQAGNIWKRGNSYYLRVKIDGKDQYQSFGSDKVKAEIAAAEYRKRAAQSKRTKTSAEVEKLFEVQPKITFGEAAEQYLASRSTKKAATLRNYRNYLKNYLQPVFGNIQISCIKESEVEYFLNELFKTERIIKKKEKNGHVTVRTEKMTAKHCNDIVRFAKAVCNVQLKRENIRRNPFTDVELLRETESRKRVIDPMRMPDIEKALAALPVHWRPLFTILALTGMRTGEAFALRWKDIDWEHRTLSISRNRVKGIEDDTKTKSSARDILLTQRVMNTFNELKKRKVCGLNDYIFVRLNGMPFDRYVDDPWRRALKKAGIRHRPSIQLRHSYISNCLEAGIDVGFIAKQVGHKNQRMIFEVYGKYLSERDTRNLGLLTDLFEYKVKKVTVEVTP